MIIFMNGNHPKFLTLSTAYGVRIMTKTLTIR